MTPAELKARRAEMKITQRVVADAFGYTVNAVEKWEAGAPIPKWVRLALIGLAVDQAAGADASDAGTTDDADD